MHTHVQIAGKQPRSSKGDRVPVAVRSIAKQSRRLRLALKAVRRQAASLERTQ